MRPLYSMTLLFALCFNSLCMADEFSVLTAKAKAGEIESQFNLGMMYYAGTGVPQDYQQAKVWFQKASEQGFAGAQYNLGLMFAKGEGVTQDYQQALVWWQKAAEQGYAWAQYNLGLMYGRGQGVKQDYVQSHKWLRIAAVSGLENAKQLMDTLGEELTPEQSAESLRLAREWLESHNSSNSRSASPDPTHQVPGK